MRKTERPADRRFQLILIKPSHYDADGYVVQWLRSTMPSNSLAAVFSLANGAAERTAARPRSAHRRHRHRRDQHARRAARRSRAASPTTAGSVWSGLSACSPTNSPARVDIARPLREAGIQVMIGGFHVSGCLSMLKEIPERHPEGAGSRHFDLRRRSRGASRRGVARRRARRAEAALQLHEALCRTSATSPPRPSCLTISSSAPSAT